MSSSDVLIPHGSISSGKLESRDFWRSAGKLPLWRTEVTISVGKESLGSPRLPVLVLGCWAWSPGGGHSLYEPSGFSLPPPPHACSVSVTWWWNASPLVLRWGAAAFSPSTPSRKASSSLFSCVWCSRAGGLTRAEYLLLVSPVLQGWVGEG